MARRLPRGLIGIDLLGRSVLAIALLAVAGWYLIPQAEEWSQRSGELRQSVIATDDVNLRSGPDLKYDVLAVISAGTKLFADRESVNGFSAVTVEHRQGWISTDYLAEPGAVFAAEIPSEATETPPEPTFPEPTLTEPAPSVVPISEPVVAQSTQGETEPQPGENWISVNRSDRTVTLHDGEIVVAQFDALIGKDLSADGYYSTAVGTYQVHVKEKALVETPFADGVYLTDFVGFDPDRSNGFHSPVRDEFGNVVVTGGTSTLGCVRLSEADAQFLFDFAYIGMRVEVHD